MNKSEKQVKLCLQIMIHHKFLKTYVLKYNLECRFISLFIKQLCNELQDTIFLKLFFVTNSDQLQFIRHEFMNNCILHNHKLMTKKNFAGHYR